MQEDSRAAHLQALTPYFFYFCPIMRHCVVHKYNVLYLVPTDWPTSTCWTRPVRSDVSLQSNYKKAAPLYDGDLPEFLFFFFFIGCVQNGLS